jgi:hypothetical protein
MRHRTYGRLLDRLEEVELRLELCFQAGVERLMARDAFSTRRPRRSRCGPQC